MSSNSSPKIPTEVKGLGISLAMIDKAKANEEVMSKALFKDIEKKYSVQAEDERNFLAHHRWGCPPSVEDAIIEKTQDMHVVSRSSRTGSSGSEDSDYMFLDAKSLETLACVAQNIVLFDGPNLRTGYNFIRKLITDVRLIGTPSQNGVVMSASMYDKYKNMIVIKAPKEYEEFTEQSINHELVVGKVLNSLRSFVPNFSFVLGAFECGPPVVKPGVGSSDKSKLITWCRGGSKVKYMMQENITNAINMYDFCEKCDAQDYLDLIIQINYALMVAYKEVGFTHYDLHGDNILIKPIDGEAVYIPYNGDFVYAKNLAMIIDYGYSHVYLPDTGASAGYKPSDGPRGNRYLYHLGYYIDRPSPMMDCYRILTATMHLMKQVNRKTYDQVYGLLYYFHPQDENLDKLYKTKDFSMIPIFGDTDYAERCSRFRYENFINYCRHYCVENDFADPVVSGKNYTDELEDAIVFAPNSMNIVRPSSRQLDLKIDSIDELFDIIEPVLIYKKYLRGIDERKRQSYEKLLNKIYAAVRSQQNAIVRMMQTEIDHMIESLKDLPVVNYKSIPRNDVYSLRTPMVMKDYLNNFERTVKHLDEMDYIQRRIEMLQYVDTNMTKSLGAEIKALEKEYMQKDDRKVFTGFIRKDMGAIAEYIDSKRNLDKTDDKIDTIFESMLSVVPA